MFAHRNELEEKMKRLQVEKTTLPLIGTVRVPGDKSISHRAVMFGAVADGPTVVQGFLTAEDCLRTVDCFRKMGVRISDPSAAEMRIEGCGWEGLQEPTEVLDVGNSGTTIRLLLGILAGRPFHAILQGDSSIARRPMKRVVEPLRSMGARIDGRQDGQYAPLAVRGGGLVGRSLVSPVASAQVKSAILLAGLQAEGTTTFKEPSLSRDHTERMLSAFGVRINTQGTTISVEGGQRLQGDVLLRVPGDISSAAYFLAAATLVPGSRLTLKEVGINPTRTGLLDVLETMGGKVHIVNRQTWGGEPVADLYVEAAQLQAMTIEGDLIPRLIDEIPVIAVLATQAEGTTVIRDAQELRVKESDRIAMVSRFLNDMGAQVEPTDDGMIIHGPTPLKGAVVDTAGDHRIGMAAFVAGLIADGPTQITRAEAINVSFPDFARQFQGLFRSG